MSVLLEGFLQKQSGGIFLKKKQKWATLKTDGTLSLSKKPELPPSSEICIYELDDVVYCDEDCSISFSSVHNGSILKAYKFFALESPTFEEWTQALDKVRNDPTPEYTDGRSRYVRDTMSVFESTSKTEGEFSTAAVAHNFLSPALCTDARVTLTDEELEKQVDPILLIQSSGEPISMCGYVKKRGGAYGGNTSYKKRFFVLTIFGRVVYFSDQKKTRALGQFSLVNATIQHTKQQEISVVTPTRVWFLKFDSEATRLEWTAKLESVANCVSSKNSLSEESPPAGLSTTANEEHSDSATTENLSPKFRRNMSLLVRQKSNIDGLGFSVLDKMNENNKKTDNTAVSNIESGKSNTVSVACITWNLSESLPKMQQCRFIRQYRKYQIVVVGVQECQSVIYHSFSPRQLSPLDIWLAMMKSIMGDNFTLVASRSMGAIHMCVFVREDVVGKLTDVNTAHVPCGIGNVMHNKGAVAVTMMCSGISFGFICAHLAANQDKTQERNLDFHRISHLVIEQLGKKACDTRRSSVIALDKNKTQHQAGLFYVYDDRSGSEDVYADDDTNSPQFPHQSGRVQTKVGGGQGHSDSHDSLAKEFDRCFFMGDLNYRVDASKEWIEYYLKMAEIMRSQEKEDKFQLKANAQMYKAELDLDRDPALDDEKETVDAGEQKNIEKVSIRAFIVYKLTVCLCVAMSDVKFDPSWRLRHRR